MEFTELQRNLENISLGIFLTLFCFGGVIGNIITTIVLVYQERKKSIDSNLVVNFFLIGLAISDTLFLFTWSNVGIAYLHRLIFGQLPANYFESEIGAYFNLFIRPVGYIGQVGSTLFTVAITFDRYLAIIHTFWSLDFWTRKRGIITTLGIFGAAITFAIPFYFALQVKEIEVGNSTVAAACSEKNNEIGSKVRNSSVVAAAWIVENNRFGCTRGFANYNLWFFTIINSFIPIPLLLIFNWAIYKRVREAQNLRATMTRSQIRDISLAKILLCIVLVFGICNIPAITRCIIFSFAYQEQQIRLSDAGRVESYMSLTILRILDWLCICINSSVNFIIYCVMSRSFRQSMKEIVSNCSKCWSRNDQIAGEINGLNNNNQRKASTSTNYTIDTSGSGSSSSVISSM